MPGNRLNSSTSEGAGNPLTMHKQAQITKGRNQVLYGRLVEVGQRILSIPAIGLLVSWGILILVLSRLAPFFLTTNNVLTITRFSATSFIAGAGMTIALIGGGLDLSLGATMMVAGVVVGSLFLWGIPLPLALLAGLATGPVVGLVNGLLITRARINPLIATIGMMFVLRSAGFIAAGGQAKAISVPAFKWARESPGGVPMPIYFLGAVFLVVYYLLNHTKLGRHIRAVGGNPQAARHGALDVERYRLTIYMIAASLSALAGVLLGSIISSMDPHAAQGRELEVATAVLLGGASLTGGKGSIFGTLLGVLFVSSLFNGLVGLGVVPEWVPFINGALLIAAVAIDQVPKGGFR